MRPQVVLAVLAAAGCGVVIEPGTAPEKRHDTVVGGTADDGGFPDVVMLRTIFTNDAGLTQGFACSGTVITPRVVLAAAHCFNENGGPSGYALTGVSVHNFNVALQRTVRCGGPEQPTRLRAEASRSDRGSTVHDRHHPVSRQHDLQRSDGRRDHLSCHLHDRRAMRDER